MGITDPAVGRVAARPSLVKGLVAGVAGGIVGSLAMVAFQGATAWLADEPMRPAEDDVAGDGAPAGAEPSTIRGAKALARQAGGVAIPPHHERHAGHAFHFAFGVGLGGAYGVLVEYARFASIGSGIPFGALQMVFADEVAVPALGLSGPPTQAPPAAHLKSLGARLLFGLVTEQVRRNLRSRL